MRNSLPLLTVIGIIGGAITGPARAERPILTIAAMTDYVYRGVSQSDEDPAAQIEASWEGDRVFIGTRLTTTRYAAPTPEIDFDRDLEWISYAGVTSPVTDTVRIQLTLSWYDYPGADAPGSGGFAEAAVALSWRNRFRLSLTRAEDYRDSGGDVHYLELWAAKPLPGSLLLSGTLAWAETSGVVGSSFAYLDIGLSHGLGPVQLDLRYHTSDADFGGPLNRLTDDRLVVSASLPF